MDNQPHMEKALKRLAFGDGTREQILWALVEDVTADRSAESACQEGAEIIGEYKDKLVERQRMYDLLFRKWSANESALAEVWEAMGGTKYSAPSRDLINALAAIRVKVQSTSTCPSCTSGHIVGHTCWG